MALTHEELLIETNRRLQIALYNGDIPALYALRAVVELHKPREGVWWISNPSLLACSVCEEWMHDGPEPQVYPCPTIQAIEKELL